MQQPKVLISIVNWMNYWDTIECVSLCKQQDYKNIEIIVVDNGSVNESVQKIKESHPDIKLIETGNNLGFAGGHKKAYHYCKSQNFDAMWLLNPDARIFPNTLVKLIEAFVKWGNGIYGSIKVDKNGNTDIDKKPKGIDGFEIAIDKSNPDYLIQTPYVNGYSFFIPSAVYREIGFLCTRYFMYVEEVDYCYNAYQKGIKSYFVKDSFLEHEGAKSFAISNGMSSVKTYYQIRNFIYFALKIRKYPRRVIRINNGGMRAILKNAFQKQDLESKYKALGVLHGYLGIRGKLLNPNSFI